MKREKSYKNILWIYILTILAGALNVYGIKILGNTVSHHTGNTSWIAINIYEKNIPYELILLLSSYFIGATFSGIISYTKGKINIEKYKNLIISIGLILVIMGIFKLDNIEKFFISFILGLQNSMIIKYRETLVRTSHITGYLTDAGFALGALIKGEVRNVWKIRFYITSIIMFTLGGIFSYFLIENTKFPIIIVGSIYIILGFLYKKDRTINL